MIFKETTLVANTTKDHYEKYKSMLDDIGFENISHLIPATKKELIVAFRKDEHLNSIPLHKWDGITSFGLSGEVYYGNIDGYSSPVTNEIRRMFAKKHGSYTMSIFDAVCLLKHAAIYRIIEAQPIFDR